MLRPASEIKNKTERKESKAREDAGFLESEHYKGEGESVEEDLRTIQIQGL